MATIDELMTGKQPGEIKICQPEWYSRRLWFQPYYKEIHESDGEYWWFGRFTLGGDIYRSERYREGGFKWQLWQEPAAAHCEDCEKLRKERDGAVETLRKVWAQLGIGEWTK